VGPHSNPHRQFVRPLVAGERALRGYRRRDGVPGGRKGREDGVALVIDLVASMIGDRIAQQPAMLGKDVAVAVTESLQQAR
jgi:hypothetical protein